MAQAKIPQLQGSFLMRLRGELDFILGRSVREKMITTSGLRLLRPALNSISEVKYSAMNDKRLLDEEQYREFEKFMPAGFSFAGKPENQTVFGYCFDEFDNFGIDRFLFTLDELTEEVSENEKKKGDIAVYYTDYPGLSEIPVHAGLYVGDDVVRSRWINGGPVVEHHMDEFPQRWLTTLLLK